MAKKELEWAIELAARAAAGAPPAPGGGLPQDGRGAPAAAELDVRRAVAALARELRRAPVVDGALLRAAEALTSLVKTPYDRAAAAALADAEGTLAALASLVRAGAAAALGGGLEPAAGAGNDSCGLAASVLLPPALLGEAGQLLERTVRAGTLAAHALGALAASGEGGLTAGVVGALGLGPALVSSARLDGRGAELTAGLRTACLGALAALAGGGDAALAGRIAGLEGCLPALAAATLEGGDAGGEAGRALANLELRAPELGARIAEARAAAAPPPPSSCDSGRPSSDGGLQPFWERLQDTIVWLAPAALALGAAVLPPLVLGSQHPAARAVSVLAIPIAARAMLGAHVQAVSV
ncbi:hypothetical protein Rsub_11176 [Raphidocelis subcapitata]|uniref:Uncharacterized protein n=1 Tax=Raphidocelis subcapitata TaxID=307507 RepID=A0A2V0PLP5_9CHLO|nr:hypothetical protein Rsub_11176 [Raphidocelis subcapitata]|eukprot:GBF98770.1 hypothetical protein Rsub_11176 [Raphidocelis subcapitata]